MQVSIVRRSLGIALLVGLLVVLLLGALRFADFHRRALLYPFTFDYGEGPLLNQALLLARGEQIYHANLETSPWTIANYPPLYMLLQAPLTSIFGPAYWYGRAISLLSTLAAALFAGLIVHALSGDRLAGVISGLVLLMVPYVGYWSALARIDCLALGLSLGGLYCAARWPERRAGLVASALLLTAAIFTRQTYGLAAPFAAFVWLLTLSPRRALLWALGLAGLCLGLFVALNVLSGGGFFLNVVTANVNAYQLDLLRSYAVELLTRLPVLLLGSAAFVLLAGWRGVRSWRLIAPYWVGAVAAALTIGKIGSNVNYLLELSAAMSIGVGALIAWQRGRPWLRQATMLVLALQTLVLLPPSPNHVNALQAMDDPSTPQTLLGVVQSADGPVLADEWMGLLPLAGRPIELQPFEMTQLARAERWDQRQLLYAIAQQQYAAILIFRTPGYPLERDRWTDEMLGAIELAYQLRVTIGITEIYEPRR